MYKINSFIVYGKKVCKIADIRKNRFNNEDYYLLIPIDDPSLKIEIPVSNKLKNTRELISKEDIFKVINNIPNIETIKIDERFLENEYKNLLASGTHEDLIKIIKTTYLRNKERLDNKKRIGDKDNHYFELAEKYLYNEFSVVLNLNFDETKQYVIEQVSKITI